MIVELGGGECPKFSKRLGNGINVDIRPSENVDLVADFEKPLPLPSGEYEGVYSQFVIEHVSWINLQQFINEIYRILKPSGKAVIVTANLKAQVERLLSKEKWELDDLCMVFGGQDYLENSHKSSMSPELAVRLFENAGFKKVNIQPLVNCCTDMTIEAEKMTETKFSRAYFEGLGYKGRFYRDYYQHYRTADMILDRNPTSVLDVGGGRGYICRILQTLGVRADCLDISQHVWHTRAIENIYIHDATQVPWNATTIAGFQGTDKQYDLCFSLAFLEHIQEDKLEQMIKEMARVSKRGLHGITVEVKDAKDDATHVTIRPLAWWQDLFKRVVPEYPVEILDKEVLESLPAGCNDTDVFNRVAPRDDLVKLNVGSFTDMYYYNWINIDIADLEKFAQYDGYRFERRDLRQGFVGILDNSVDIVLASHFIEHLNREDGKKFLLECKRVLKKGGLLRLAVPDSKLLADLYVKTDLKQFANVNIGVEHATDDAEAFYHLLLAGHQTIYDFASLKKILTEIGFENISDTPPFRSNSEIVKKQTIPMYPTLSVYLECRKPEEPRLISTSTHVKDKLNIALISTPFLDTPPKDYGGLELVVADLGEELASMGHNVTIFATEGSSVKGCKVVGIGKAVGDVNVDWLQAETRMYDVYKDMLEDFDIIHGHNWFGMEFRVKALNPSLHVLHTHHGGLSPDWWLKSKPPFKLNFISISKWMKQVYESQGMPSRAVYNGIDLSRYPLQEKKGDRFLFLSRISKIKAPHVAIQVAKMTGIKLDIVGATHFVDDLAYVDEVRRACDGDKIRFIGEVSHEDKLKYLQNAKALLVTGKWGEPFGLHVIEALSTGSSVIAINDGGIGETLQEGGVLCQDLDSMVDAVQHFKAISPIICRNNAKKFSRMIMSQNYIKAYHSILSGNEW